MVQLSVVVITKNEEKNLVRCLQSVQDIADEIIVLDSLSDDKTVAIAERFGAKVYLQAFLGYVAQKNLADSKAGNDWIFSIDADEEVSPGLLASIKAFKNRPSSDAYYVSRLTNYCGRWIKHCGWYPDRKIRMYNRTKGSWQGEMIHERWELHDGNSTGNLNGDLLHYSYYTLSDHIRQIEKFSEIAARAEVARGKKVSLLKLVFAPWWKFVGDYFFRLGMLDGIEGYYICKYSAFASFAKYSKIRQYGSKVI